jgi:hypothetical protein
MNAPLIHIGASKAAVKEARAAINDILRAPQVENGTKVEALRTLATLCNVSGTSISGCHIQGAQ